LFFFNVVFYKLLKGKTIPEIANELNLLSDTIRKGIKSGRIKKTH